MIKISSFSALSLLCLFFSFPPTFTKKPNAVIIQKNYYKIVLWMSLIITWGEGDGIVLAVEGGFDHPILSAL